MAIEIQKGIPIPEKRRVMKEASEITKALKTIEVGDSFTIPFSDKKKVEAAINSIRKKEDKAYIFSETQIQEGELRVHRVPDTPKRPRFKG